MCSISLNTQCQFCQMALLVIQISLFSIQPSEKVCHVKIHSSQGNIVKISHIWERKCSVLENIFYFKISGQLRSSTNFWPQVWSWLSPWILNKKKYCSMTTSHPTAGRYPPSKTFRTTNVAPTVYSAVHTIPHYLASVENGVCQLHESVSWMWNTITET
jgi:hypothetical protein